MDCEKFDQHVVDALYEELDELTHAGLDRHVEGCSRCAGIYTGLRATRRVALLPLEEPPDDLESRILAAAAVAMGNPVGVPQTPPVAMGNPVPAVPAPIPLHPRRKAPRALAWAARPELAVAAVFFLVLGSTMLLYKGSAKAPDAAPAAAGPAPEVAATAAAAAPAALPEPAADEAAKAPPAAYRKGILAQEKSDGDSLDDAGTRAPARAGAAATAIAMEAPPVAATPSASTRLAGKAKATVAKPADAVALEAPSYGNGNGPAPTAAASAPGGTNPRARAAPAKNVGFGR